MGRALRADGHRKGGVLWLSYEQGVVDAAGQSLGSYAFLCGLKMEGTSTWFGMFLYAYSEAGNAATANVSLLVKGE